MLARQMFICSAIKQCRELVNCCPHKQPHIKDERCVPRECRYAPGVDNIDCDQYDPANPRAPVPVPVEPVKTVEQKPKEDQEAEQAHIQKEVPEPALPKVTEMIIGTTKNGLDIVVPVDSKDTKEQDIKEQVKKTAASQRPVTIKKPQKKGKGS